MRIQIASFILGIALLSACQQQPEESVVDTASHLGEISFSITGSDAAASEFHEGMLLLYSFEYEDAAEHFQAAQALDSTCVMAYWGEAMTKNHPLWQAQYTDEAHEILKRLGQDSAERIAQAPTELEREFLQAAELLFGEGDKYDRDAAYSAHLGKMHETYPENNEIAALYALSLLGVGAEDRSQELYERSAQIAKGILAENPQHPGALHYLIHSYDDPAHAHMALDAANDYSRVAPDAGHALHMPSHIYIALGMWDEVISSNIAAWNAGNKRKAAKDLDNDSRNYHAMHWLMYAYLQKGQIDEARLLLDSMFYYGNELPSNRARAYMTSMRASYLVDALAWDDTLATMAVDDSNLNISIRSVNQFIAGMHAYQHADLDQLQAIIRTMKAAREAEATKLMQRGAAMCSGIGRASQLPTQQDINHAHIMEMELQAFNAMLSQDTQQVELWLNEAVNLEQETAFMFGPPVIAKPSAELYAEWLMSRELAEEADAQYSKALERASGRRQIVEGKRAVTSI